jgi:phage replication initiation protein
MPPSSNTGAENISALVPVENRVLIDWLAWTVPVTDVDAAISMCGLSFLDWSESGHGGMGYRASRRAGHIVVFYDGAENMGVHFSMSGQGCREFEGRLTNDKNRVALWYRFLHGIQAANSKIARLDLAIDTVDGSLPLDLVEASIRSGRNQSRFRSSHKYEELPMGNEVKPLGKTIYLGSPTSRIKVRFYDKLAESGIVAASGQSWVRAEIQAMGERASEAVALICKGVEVGRLAAGVLNNYFRPINSESVNKSQCTTQEWWALWISTTEKIRLSTAKAVRYITDVMDYLKYTYGATLATIRKFLGVTAFSDFIYDCLSVGSERMRRKHEEMILISNLDIETHAYMPF